MSRGSFAWVARATVVLASAARDRGLFLRGTKFVDASIKQQRRAFSKVKK